MNRAIQIVCVLSLALIIDACAKKTTTLSNNSSNTSTQSGSPPVTPLFIGSCNVNGSPFGGGNGSAGNPYMICGAAQIARIGTDPNYVAANYVLLTDLDLGGAYLYTPPTFSGIFDGMGHTISNAEMHAPFVDTLSGTVRNLNFARINAWGSWRFGIVAGHTLNGSVISHCTVDATILSSYGTGGIVGFNEGTVDHCSANVSDQGTDHHGGITGWNRGMISNSFATGSIMVGADHAGGLVGDNLAAATGGTPGTITNSYSWVAVSGASNIGGLAGSNEGNITDGYSKGTVTGSAGNTGGFVGANTGGVTNCFWDQQTSGQSASAAGTGESSAAMANPATFAGFDFSAIWSTPTSGYPTLR
jgi:hypothetical protein